MCRLALSLRSWALRCAYNLVTFYVVRGGVENGEHRVIVTLNILSIAHTPYTLDKNHYVFCHRLNLRAPIIVYEPIYYYQSYACTRSSTLCRMFYTIWRHFLLYDLSFFFHDCFLNQGRYRNVRKYIWLLACFTHFEYSERANVIHIQVDKVIDLHDFRTYQFMWWLDLLLLANYAI